MVTLCGGDLEFSFLLVARIEGRPVMYLEELWLLVVDPALLIIVDLEAFFV